MCSILGLANFKEPVQISDITLESMGKALSHRGPDQNGVFRSSNVCFQHNRLAVIDVENGLQPMIADFHGARYVIVYNGEIYNTDELREQLIQSGVNFSTHCDTEVVLYSYIVWGMKCSEKLNGIFAFAIYDQEKRLLYLSRDRMGVKPLFYTQLSDTLIFSSEIKGFFKHPDIKAEIDEEGLWQLLFISPMRHASSGVFKGIYELPPGCHAVFDDTGLKIERYWSLQAFEMEDSEDAIVEKTRYLLTDAIIRQLVSDVPLCTLLSGGIDSSVITSVASRNAKWGKPLETYSFEYENNKKYFTSTLFQPQSDDEYALYLAQYLGTDHTVLTVSTETIAELLYEAVIYRDLPGMADIDSSLLYFCREIKKNHTVAISGECSDEIFGGYPWFYRPEMLNTGYFPWIYRPLERVSLFKKEVAKPEKGFEYIKQLFEDSVNSCPRLPDDSEEMADSRISTWLSVNWFMNQLLERKDRMSMATGLEIRVPFADHRILEYVYNVPWSIKYKNKVEKALLRSAARDYLPEKILTRKKSPYPKTRNPEYGKIVTNILKERLSNPGSELKKILCSDALERVTGESGEFGNTWFGQLMSRDQLIAWLIQLDFWFEHYRVSIV